VRNITTKRIVAKQLVTGQLAPAHPAYQQQRPIMILGLAHGRLPVAAADVVELGTVVVEVVEDGETVLSPVAIGLGSTRSSERPWMLSASNGL